MFLNDSNDLNSVSAEKEKAVREFADNPTTKKTITAMAELVSSFDIAGFKMGCVINGVTYHITFEKQNPDEDDQD